jgi:uncharacterized protein YhbP (UPF0306 family)
MEVKLQDSPALNAFLGQQAVAVIAVPVDIDGTLHAATLHYWHRAEPLKFYFVTGKDTEKCRMLLDGKSVKAACVVGTNPGTAFSLQMRGSLAIVNADERTAEVDAYYQKHAGHPRDIADPKNVLLEFTPSWARFTDPSKGYGPVFLNRA